MMKSLPEPLLLAVADVMHDERAARTAADRELKADIARARERIDEYGNVIDNKIEALGYRMRELVGELVAAIEVKDGEPGPAGVAGETGQPGLQGIQGEPGPDGKDGAPGVAGETGQPGLQGIQGEPGPPGEKGEAAVATPWRHRRAYDPAATDYLAGDVVALDGGSSVALVDNPGPCPGDGWAQLTQRGKNGKPGERGQRGEAGRDGVGIDDLFVERGMLVVLLTDGRHKELPLSEAVAA